METQNYKYNVWVGMREQRNQVSIDVCCSLWIIYLTSESPSKQRNVMQCTTKKQSEKSLRETVCMSKKTEKIMNMLLA